MSYIIYAILTALILWGMKFAGKNGFNDDFMSLEATKCLQGICALCIMLHHISQTPAYRQSGELAIFPEAGFLFVGIFFFCSGFGLVKSSRTKPTYMKSFLGHRLPSVLVPFYMMTAAYALYYIAVGRHMGADQWILSALGLVLMNPHAWYVVVVTLLYVAFYFAFRRSGEGKKPYIIMGIFILAQLVFGIIWGHLAWWAGQPFWWQSPNGFATAHWWMEPAALWFQGEWWINSTILFLAGMLFARFEKNVVDWLKKKYWIKFVTAIAILVATAGLSVLATTTLSWWSEFGPERSLGFGKKAICLVTQCLYGLSFSAVVFMAMMKARSTNPVSKFLGAMTLEVYLMHNLCLMQFGPLVGNYPGGMEGSSVAAKWPTLALFAALVVGGGIILGTIFKFLNGKILRLMARER